MTAREILCGYDRMESEQEQGNKIRILAELNACEVEDIVILLKLSNRHIPEFIPSKSTGLGSEKGSKRCKIRKKTLRKTHEQCIYFCETCKGKHGAKRGICSHPVMMERKGKKTERGGSWDACRFFKRRDKD